MRMTYDPQQGRIALLRDGSLLLFCEGSEGSWIVVDPSNGNRLIGEFKRREDAVDCMLTAAGSHYASGHFRLP